MNSRAFTEALSSLELELRTITESLANADSDRLLIASEALRQKVLDLSALAQKVALIAPRNPQLRQQLIAVSTGLALCRENLIRRSALVQRRLQTIVPASGADHYGKMASPYAKLARQSAWSGVQTA